MNGLIVVFVLLGVIGIYILTYWLNKKTKPPVDVDPEIGCESCALNGRCSIKEYSKEQCEHIYEKKEQKG